SRKGNHALRSAAQRLAGARRDDRSAECVKHFRSDRGKMKRGLVNSTAVLSTLMLAATIVLWVRSYWVPENIGWVRESWPEPATLRSVSVCITPMDGKFTFDYTRSEQRLAKEDLTRLQVGNPTRSRFVWRRVSNGAGMFFPTTNWLG